MSLSAAFTSFSPRVLPLASFNPPILAPFWSDSDAGDGGLVLYAETQDSMLLTQAANEVMTAFPNQPTFTPMSLFIATWLQVPPFNGPGVSRYNTYLSAMILDLYSGKYFPSRHGIRWSAFICYFRLR